MGAYGQSVYVDSDGSPPVLAELDGEHRNVIQFKVDAVPVVDAADPAIRVTAGCGGSVYRNSVGSIRPSACGAHRGRQVAGPEEIVSGG
ncbi:hypothetical protein SDC9_205913 [bioreactor metagenome]|uniref:Uncharacterized protein n=1 Tax=bioreactor metagenome TaxID=1076179 RepID=A0A645J4Z3_9ZZZZ